MQVTIDPPMHTWKPRVPDAALIARRRAMGFSDPEKPIIATGHQPGFWHPGILAKYIATDVFARKTDGVALNVVVDQDVAWGLSIAVPLLSDGHLLSDLLTLGPLPPDDTPFASRAAIDPQWAVRCIADFQEKHGSGVAADLSRLQQVWRATPGPREGRGITRRLLESIGIARPKPAEDAMTLAVQLTEVVARLYEPWVAPMPTLLATQLLVSPEGLVDRLLSEARACVQHYNAAVAAHPEAGMTRLREEADRVELPLWAIAPGGARQRVFADLADSKPMLVLEPDETMAWNQKNVPLLARSEWTAPSTYSLAPRALLLTAIMRAYLCDLFIHGKGGGVYDRAMEMWWHNWTGEPLAPMAVVTADVRLDFPGVAVAEAKDVERAVWYAHHLPHNLDRLPADVVNQTWVARKRELLAHMNDDRDRKRRAAGFREIHEINRKLAEQNGDLLLLARQQVDRAMVGAANRAVAMKRDWSYAIYPKEKMEALKRVIAEAAESPR